MAVAEGIKYLTHNLNCLCFSVLYLSAHQGSTLKEPIAFSDNILTDQIVSVIIFIIFMNFHDVWVIQCLENRELSKQRTMILLRYIFLIDLFEHINHA